jgi:3-methylfumaryl-CoA hydratase
MTTLEDALRRWDPASVETTRRVDPWAVAAFADLLDASVGDVLPPLWQGVLPVEHPRQSTLGVDGHPADGAFLPPIPDRRRMFAGGRLRLSGPIPVGAQLQSRAHVAEVTVKRGRSGEMAFVRQRHELLVGGSLAAVEEQDIVYRSEPAGAGRKAVRRPGPAEPVEATWRIGLDVEETLLFRFSALTYNAHRIHYDLPYATRVEAYPGLVVHGPLLALLALELPRRHAPERRVTAFDYRLVRPSFAPTRIVATAVVEGTAVTVGVGTEGAEPSLTGVATLE